MSPHSAVLTYASLKDIGEDGAYIQKKNAGAGRCGREAMPAQMGGRFVMGRPADLPAGVYRLSADQFSVELELVDADSHARWVFYTTPDNPVYVLLPAGRYQANLRILRQLRGPKPPGFAFCRLGAMQSFGFKFAKALALLRHPAQLLARVTPYLRRNGPAPQNEESHVPSGSEVPSKTVIGARIFAQKPLKLRPEMMLSEGRDLGTDILCVQADLRGCISDAAARNASGWVLITPGDWQPYAYAPDWLSDIIAQTPEADRAYLLDLDTVTPEKTIRPCLSHPYHPDRMTAAAQRSLCLVPAAWVSTFIAETRVADLTLCGLTSYITAQYGDSALVHLPLALGVSTEKASAPEGETPAGNTEPSADRSGVSIIIPTRNNTEVLRACIESLNLIKDTAFELIVVDNGSDLASMAEYVAQLRGRDAVKVIRADMPFNFSRLCNLGAAAAHHDILLFLNDDIEATDGLWLGRMCQSLRHPDIGVVGAKLLYPSGYVQHAGIATHLVPGPGHPWRGRPETGDHPLIDTSGPVDAVTAACLMIGTADFKGLGGFDESRFAITLNDVDLCLRVRQGGRQAYYRHDAVLIHKEGQTRRADDHPAERARRDRELTAFFRAYEDYTHSSVFYPLSLRRDRDDGAAAV